MMVDSKKFRAAGEVDLAAVAQVVCPVCGAAPGVRCFRRELINRRAYTAVPVATHKRRLSKFVAERVEFDDGRTID